MFPVPKRWQSLESLFCWKRYLIQAKCASNNSQECLVKDSELRVATAWLDQGSAGRAQGGSLAHVQPYQPRGVGKRPLQNAFLGDCPKKWDFPGYYYLWFSWLTVSWSQKSIHFSVYFIWSSLCLYKTVKDSFYLCNLWRNLEVFLFF